MIKKRTLSNDHVDVPLWASVWLQDLLLEVIKNKSTFVHSELSSIVVQENCNWIGHQHSRLQTKPRMLPNTYFNLQDCPFLLNIIAQVKQFNGTELISKHQAELLWSQALAIMVKFEKVVALQVFSAPSHCWIMPLYFQGMCGMGLLLEQDSWQIHRQLSYDVSVFVTLKEIPLKWNLPWDFCQTLPIGCLCCRNLNFKIKSGCPHTHFGAGATCL